MDVYDGSGSSSILEHSTAGSPADVTLYTSGNVMAIYSRALLGHGDPAMFEASLKVLGISFNLHQVSPNGEILSNPALLCNSKKASSTSFDK